MSSKQINYLLHCYRKKKKSSYFNICFHFVGSGRVTTSSLKTKTTFGLTMGGGSTSEPQEALAPVPGDVKTSIGRQNILSRGLTFYASTKSLVQREKVLSQEDARTNITDESSGKEENQEVEICSDEDDVKIISLPGPTAISAHSASFRAVRESASMADIQERSHQQRDVATQVDLVNCSTTVQQVTATSSLIGSPGHQSNLVTFVSKPPFHHVCKIDIELCSQAVVSLAASDHATSFPTCLCTASFQQNSDHSLRIQKNYEAVEKGGSLTLKEQEGAIRGKPQEVIWDKHGMTWEVYGASVDLDCLSVAIQSHLESKIKEQQKHIGSLRRFIWSKRNPKGHKKKMESRSGVLTCCRKASTVVD